MKPKSSSCAAADRPLKAYILPGKTKVPCHVCGASPLQCKLFVGLLDDSIIVTLLQMGTSALRGGSENSVAQQQHQATRHTFTPSSS